MSRSARYQEPTAGNWASSQCKRPPHSEPLEDISHDAPRFASISQGRAKGVMLQCVEMPPLTSLTGETDPPVLYKPRPPAPRGTGSALGPPVEKSWGRAAADGGVLAVVAPRRSLAWRGREGAPPGPCPPLHPLPWHSPAPPFSPSPCLPLPPPGMLSAHLLSPPRYLCAFPRRVFRETLVRLVSDAT
ncbi:cleavage and polyadenylation specificity factor subunit 6-like [Vombatus ursinus]|uniref:cleavage and polyadenylation specificity factor subunit 6-like n=1 Tax=Vombatus ursinus TaxID=29139 RepID=UPI000FFDAE54|nr:cleavage and polyadenylation specificity factor subunit 6-like [Vombatus ursinus]